jgi:large subunit ribosomal protein L4
MRAQVIGPGGAAAGEMDLDDDLFGAPVSQGAIYHAIRNELANRRVGTAATKGRSEVSGSNRKPWRQKGTGRARAGDRKSPIWVGGGTIFGPKPRDYSYRLPRKAKRAAIRSVLAQKGQAQKVLVVDGITAPNGKTKELAGQLAGAVNSQRSVWLVDGVDQQRVRAGRNLPWLTVCPYNTPSVHDLFYAEHILIDRAATAKLADQFGKKAR